MRGAPPRDHGHLLVGQALSQARKRHRLVLFEKNHFIYLFVFGCAGSLLLCTGYSLVEASRACSLVAVPRRLPVVASLAAEQGL